jgi:hypothetical protein
MLVFSIILITCFQLVVSCRERNEPDFFHVQVEKEGRSPDAAPAQSSGAPFGGEILADFPLGEWWDPILVPVTFNRARYLFELDTGASYSVFDKSLASRLGTVFGEEEITTQAGKIKVEMYNAPNARLGAMNLSEGRLVCVMDLSQVREADGVDVRGIVGLSSLRPCVLHLDFDKHRGSICRADRDEHGDWGFQVKMECNGLNTRIAVDVEGASSFNFSLDTGDVSDGAIFGPLFDRFVREGNLPVRDGPSVIITGIKSFPEARFGIAVGPQKYKGLLFSRSSTSALGMGFLSRFKVTMDFHNERLYLKERDTPRGPQSGGYSGLLLSAIEGKVRAKWVDPNGPAGEAGIEEGDILVQFNTVDPNTLGMGRMRHELQEQGKEILLDIERDKKRQAVRFVVRKWP